MTELVSLDGRILPIEQATVSVLDRGFLYGDSVFEVFRTYGRVPFGFEEHLARLARSAERALIPLPVGIHTLATEIHAVLAAADNVESYVRVVITRGVGTALGLSPALGPSPRRVVIVTPLAEPPAELYERGIAVVTYPTQRIADHTTAAGAKLSNYLISVLAIHAAEQAGAAEAIILDHAGSVVEGSTSNVFFVKGKSLVTPPEAAGILLGITREKVLALAPDLGLRIELRGFSPAELASADEAFITSSIREVAPVVRVDGHVVGSGRPGPVSLQLLALYRALARAGTSADSRR